MGLTSIDVKDFLLMKNESNSLGLIFEETSGNGNLFIGNTPEYPNDCVTIEDVPGRGTSFTYTEGEEYIRPAVRIYARSAKYVQAGEWLNKIYRVMKNVKPFTVNNTFYARAKCLMKPMYHEKDKNGRFVWLLSVDLEGRELITN